MAGISKIQKQQILDAALVLIREKGWPAITARSLAERLGCSTMPLYSAIGSMDALREELKGRAKAMLEEQQLRTRTGNELLDFAIGYVAFAREEPRIFRFAFEAAGGGPAPAEDGRGDVLAGTVAERAETLKRLSKDAGRALSFHSWLYVHGLASLVADGALAPTDAELEAWLGFAGAAFWKATAGGEQ